RHHYNGKDQATERSQDAGKSKGSPSYIWLSRFEQAAEEREHQGQKQTTGVSQQCRRLEPETNNQLWRRAHDKQRSLRQTNRTCNHYKPRHYSRQGSDAAANGQQKWENVSYFRTHASARRSTESGGDYST